MNLDIGSGLNPKKGYLHLDKERGSPHLEVRGSINQLPFIDNVFERVNVDNVLEHLDNPLKALGEVKRITKGTACFMVPNGKYYTWKTSDSNNEHLFSWNKYTFYNFLKTQFKYVFIDPSIRQLKKPNLKYKIFLSILQALFEKNELTGICKN